MAQSSGGPLQQRLQDRIQSEVQSQSSQVRVQIEQQIQQQLAARPSPAEMAKTGQIQTALNYFTFDAGPVDGLMGQQTRSAIEDYQAYLDYPVTGQLADDEGQFLMMAFQGAQTNSAQAQQVADAHPDGIKGFVLVFRDRFENGEPPQATGVIPSFLTTGSQQSISAFCTEPIAGSVSDPSMDETLRPFFCNAVDAAIAHSDALSFKVAGFTPAQIEEQCIAFEPALVSIVASVSNSRASDVMQSAAEFVQRTGQDPEEMAGIAQICLGVGYRLDHLDLAIGSTVLLTTLGAPIFGEYAGYHLSLGLGADLNTALAASWFEAALQAIAEPTSDFEAQTVERLEALQLTLVDSREVNATGTAQIPAFSTSD